MKKTVFFTTALILSALYSLAASDFTAGWARGNEYYHKKAFDSAAYCFEQLAALKPANPEIYYNLGNTYYRLNRIPKAILNYERALRLDPEYRAARENLQLAQARIANRLPESRDIFFIKWWNEATRAQKATTWAVIALSLFILIIAFSIFRRFQKQQGVVPVQLQGVLWLACICFLILSFWSSKNAEQHNSAVVMVADAPLMNVDLKGKPIALIPEGTTIKIITKSAAWAEIRLPDGRTGWIQFNQVEII